jgi:hypothetical protein
VAVPAAPVVPAAGMALAGLFAILSFAVCIGAKHTWDATLGWLFLKLAELLDAVSFEILTKTIAPFGFLSNALRAASHNTSEALAYAALKSEAGAVWLFSQAWARLQDLGRELAALAEATVALGVWMGKAEKLALHKVSVAVMSLVHHAIAQAQRDFRRTFAFVLRQAKAATAVVHHAVAVTLPHALAEVDARIGLTSRQIRRLARRMTRAEKLLAAGVSAAVIVRALSRRGFGCFFGRNGQMLGKRLCRVDSDFLDALLLSGLFVSSVVSVREFAKDLQAIEDEVIDVLSKIIREFPSPGEIVHLDGTTFPH